MVLAGAGGHALELLDILDSLGLSDGLSFFDQSPYTDLFLGKFPVSNSLDQMQILFQSDPRFILAVGNPNSRKNLTELLEKQGGKLIGLKAPTSKISDFAQVEQADILDNCWIGSQVRLGKGVLVNVGAQVHHEATVGDFSVINPAAVLLGACEIGELTSIGAHATVLPGVKIGNRVKVGAGAVIVRDVEDGLTVVGVPGKVVSTSLQ